MRLSYAQNLEDLHLDLMFADVPAGTYVDVGGGHPVADNVSFYFYLKGWRGLIVEPQKALADAYRAIRPRDAVFEGLAGARDGDAEFHEVAGLHGLSSMRRDTVEEARRFGATFATSRRPMRRLDVLIREADLGAIDFLKIDVEGAEGEVLAGLDLARVRPRAIVLEAVNPGNPKGEPGEWEAGLLAARYRFAFFDGLNRFYVADEAADLAKRLPAGPTPWDRVAHLWDCGRAPHNPAHVDHRLARIVEHGLFALLPDLPPELLGRILREGLARQKLDPATPEGSATLLGTAEYPGREPVPADLDALIASDRFRAALGRIACFYDGGHIVD